LDRVELLGRGKVDLTIGSALDVFGGDLPYAHVCAWHNEHKAPEGQAAEPSAQSEE
jgi:phosphoribosylformimino-5-aminoimidazole carboxamide ribotide isomerase